VIIRYRDAEGTPRVGVTDEGGTVRRAEVTTFAELLGMPLSAIRSVIERAATGVVDVPSTSLPPIDGATELWASGVTYLRSREARREESESPDVYTLVYSAERPELFFKSVAWRVVGDGEPIGIREDSALNVPEPELAIVVNSAGELVGYTVCDDVSSRTLEGENPLYLPQAKMYAGAAALGPGVLPTWEHDGSPFPISVDVRREGVSAWSAETSSSQLKRTFDELIGFATRAENFPAGLVLSTGTGSVPELDFTLAVGDEVAVTIGGIGTLTNTVVTGRAPFSDFGPSTR
jgi:2-dehydro-3-deoxy-D-arabinonate dehydratase